MSSAGTYATALRVLAQLRRDPRTIALVLVMPPLLLWLLKLLLEGRPGAFDRLGAPLIGLFPFIQMFLVTTVTVLRERTSGTLERLMSMPLPRSTSSPATRSHSPPWPLRKPCSPRRSPS
jgi:ABC-2 type transport system permease protein